MRNDRTLFWTVVTVLPGAGWLVDQLPAVMVGDVTAISLAFTKGRLAA
jgi:hypothetical protein